MINAKLLQLVIDASNDGIVVAEQEDDNILIYANPAFARLTGYSNDDILYQDCRFLQGQEHDQPGLETIRTAVKKPSAVPADHSQLPQGRQRVLERIVNHASVQ